MNSYKQNNFISASLSSSKNVIVKKITALFLTLIIALIFIAPIISLAEESDKLIEITADNLTDENIYKYHDVNIINKMPVLFDRQSELPKTADEPLPPANQFLDDVSWKPNFSPDVNETSGYIDFNGYYKISKIILYDINGNQSLTISSGEPFAWKTESVLTLNKYRGWQEIFVNIPSTRYLHFSVMSTVAGFSEVGVYGRKDTTKTAENYNQAARVKPKTPVNLAFGVNAFVDDPLRVSKVGGHIREFHNITFTSNSKNYFNPSANNSWNFDAYYKSLFDKGIDVIPCIQGTNVNISGEDIEEYTGNEKPLMPGQNALDPKSYAQHASIMFNYAARYGKTKVSESRLNLGDNQQPISGLGYITYYENFNEPNKDWEGRKSYFTPYELAAMCSADYDGHEKSMGENVGIVNADKNAKLVMGGLVGRNVIEYINLMKVWFEHNRVDKKFVVDVVNFHFYAKSSVTENEQYYEKLKQAADWVHQNLPGVEVWVTEFGPEIQKSEIQDQYSDEYYEAKGYATVRMYLQGIAAGIDRMTMFMLRDTESGIYSTDGLTTQKGEWQTKKSWHYVFGAKTALKNSYFDSIVTRDENMIVYKFKAPNREIYALWSLDANKPINNYRLKVSGKLAHLTTLADSYAEGLTNPVKIENGAVSVNVTARPIFVSVYQTENASIPPTKKLLNVESISGDSNTLKKIQVLFDQQSAVPITPTAKVREEFINYEGTDDYLASNPNVPENRLYPISGVIDLGKEHFITDVGLYDSYSSGDIIFYALNEKMEWVEITSSALDQFNVWRIYEIEKPIATRFIKVERYSEATCMEVSLYGYPQID